MAFRNPARDAVLETWIEPRLEPQLAPGPRAPASEVFDTGRKTIVDCAHVKVERLDTSPVLFSKAFKEFEDWKGQKYDYRYWAERENYFLREFLKRPGEFTHVVLPRHLISEEDAAKQVLTCDAGITIANWLRVKARYPDTATLSNPFQRADAFLRLVRACLVALKELHGHRIVHCDIKEDNICIPYSPQPRRGDRGGDGDVHIEYDKLKIIDFAFSVAHAIPLTQVLVIDPEERVPYQSDRLIDALRSDRRSGSPNAVQQLDCRVDLFSLGYMAEKISARGLDCPAVAGSARLLEDVRGLVQRLKAFDSGPPVLSLPHDGLIADVDRLLATAAATGEKRAPLQFRVDGEWTAQEMADGRGASRKTPLTPVALPPPTPVAAPVSKTGRERASLSVARAGAWSAAALAVVAAGILLLRQAGEVETPRPSPPVQEKKSADDGSRRLLSLLRSDEELVFQAAVGELAQLSANARPAAASVAQAITAEYGDALAGSGGKAARGRALARLAWLAKAGHASAAQRIAGFEKDYDRAKASIAKSAWWIRGEGAVPEGAARWLEDGALLAEQGDRPAMLDVAFARARGRVVALDRAAAGEAYLGVLARSGGSDEAAAKIRQSALRGLAAVLVLLVEQGDRAAAQRLGPLLAEKADAVGAEIQYYTGLLNECVARPADLDAARQWYRMAARDPAWKRHAEDKERVLGRWCPRS